MTKRGTRNVLVGALFVAAIAALGIGQTLLQDPAVQALAYAT